MTGCIEWPYARTNGGYGAMWFDGKHWSTHRLAWHLINGPIPSGLVIRHKCDNRACYNIEHLEIGNYKDNEQDKLDRGRNPKANQSHCIRGHEFTEENTGSLRGAGRKDGRQCRECCRMRSKEQYQRIKLEKAK